MISQEIDERFDHMPMSEQMQTKIESVRISARSLAHTINAAMPDGRYKSMALTALEDAAMYANKGITHGGSL